MRAKERLDEEISIETQEQQQQQQKKSQQNTETWNYAHPVFPPPILCKL